VEIITDERDRPLAFSAYEQLPDGYAERARRTRLMPTSNARRRRDYCRMVPEWTYWMLAVDRASRRRLCWKRLPR